MKTQEKELRRHQIIRFYGYTYHACFNRDSHISTMLPQTPSIIAGVICGICVVVMLPGFMIIQPNNSRVLTFSADMPERSLVTVSIG